MPKKKKKAVVPRLRFPEFRDAGEWEVKKIGDIFRITCQVPCDHIPRSRERLFLARELIDVFLSCEEAV